MAKFIHYSSIENAYRQKVIDSITREDNGEDWVVTEKAHGANACFIIGENGVEYGKRRSKLSKDEARTFYNSLEVFQKYHAASQHVWKLLGGKGVVTIYGELLGGAFPGLEPPTRSTTPVQKDIYYCPQNDFYAFDILHSVDGQSTHIDYDKCEELFIRVGFVYAKAIFRGPFTKALEWSAQNNAIPSLIPELYGCTVLENNIREGHVLKPVTPLYTPNGSRVILKDKNEQFSERCKKPKSTADIAVQQDIPEHLQEIIESVGEYITNTRLDNVLSKEGKLTLKLSAKIAGLLTQDALKDWEKEWEGESIKKADRKIVNKELLSIAQKLVGTRLSF